MNFKPEITIGDIASAISIILSAFAVVLTWWRQQQLKRKEYADRIRNAAAIIAAKLDRWRELSLHLFDEIQQVITEADMMLVKDKNQIATRDFLWRNLVSLNAVSAERKLDEQIQMAYVDLYGYDPRIQQLYTKVLEQIKIVDEEIFKRVLLNTQSDILSLEPPEEGFKSTDLGNILRSTCSQISKVYAELLSSVIDPFREEMVKLIKSGDKILVNRSLQIANPKEVWPKELRRRILDIATPDLYLNQDIGIPCVPIERELRDWLNTKPEIPTRSFNRGESIKTEKDLTKQRNATDVDKTRR